jgi:hypothetical protein
MAEPIFIKLGMFIMKPQPISTAYSINPSNFFFKLAGWDIGYCGHYWPIVPAPDDKAMVIVEKLVE